MSKDIGLFPQSSKIEIHRIRDISEELKTVSDPIGSSPSSKLTDQSEVVKRLVSLSPRYRVHDYTKFKYMLGAALPNAPLTKRLIRILEHAPHLALSVERYLSRCTWLPHSSVQAILRYLEQNEVYAGVHAALLRPLVQRVRPDDLRLVETHCKQAIKKHRWVHNAEFRSAIMAPLLVSNQAGWGSLNTDLVGAEKWWMRSNLVQFLKRDALGDPSYEALLNSLLRDSVLDVALVAADHLIKNNLNVVGTTSDIHKGAQFALKSAGHIGRIRSDHCPVRNAMAQVVGDSIRPVKWSKILRNDYKLLAGRAARWKAASESNASSFINMSDVINDMILNRLFPKDGTIGAYTLGNIGACLQAHHPFARKYPKLYAAVDGVHNLRLESELSHSVVKKTGAKTRPIKFGELIPVKRSLLDGYLELWNSLTW